MGQEPGFSLSCGIMRPRLRGPCTQEGPSWYTRPTPPWAHPSSPVPTLIHSRRVRGVRTCAMGSKMDLRTAGNQSQVNLSETICLLA